MGWGKIRKKLTKKIEKITGISGHDLGMIALSPFTAGASLLGTSSAKSMFKNPGGTIQGAISGFETGGPLGALLGAMSGGGGWDAMFGGDASGNSASSAVAEQYRYNLALQQQNQQWQTAMSNTAHQREVQDLEKAGLNPILSAGGAGASTGTPGGGTVGMPDKVAEKTAEMQNKIAKGTLMNEILNGIAQRKLASAESAKAAANIINETKLTNAQVRNLDAGTTKTTTTTNKDTAISELYDIPIIRNILAFGSEFFGGNAGGAAVTATSAKGISNSLKKPETTVTNTYNAKGKLTGSKTSTKRR